MTVLLYPPGPTSKLPLGYGHVVRVLRDPLKFFMDVAAYGEIAHYNVNGMDSFMVNKAEYVRDVLVTHQHNFGPSSANIWLKRLIGEGLLTSDGEFHMRQRRLAQPAFHRKRLASYADVMTGYSLRRQENWQSGQQLKLADEMMRLTLEIVSKTLFDADIAIEKDNNLEDAMHGLVKWSERALYPTQISGILDKLPLPDTLLFKKSIGYIDNMLYDLIKQRRANTEDKGDLLSMLLLARDEETDNSRMTDKQAHDEIITFFLAGHETTALALTWSWYLLTQNAEVEAKFHKEIDQVLQGRIATVADIPKLRYTEQIFTESLRLYPPAWVTSRRVIKPHVLGGYNLPVGSNVTVSPYVLHHNPRYFPDPYKFEPERWTPEFKAQLPKLAYFPFGAGSRMCIGEPFAWMEGILILATLGQNWKFKLVPGQQIKPHPLITLRPNGPIMVALEKRVNRFDEVSDNTEAAKTMA